MLSARHKTESTWGYGDACWVAVVYKWAITQLLLSVLCDASGTFSITELFLLWLHAWISDWRQLYKLSFDLLTKHKHKRHDMNGWKIHTHTHTLTRAHTAVFVCWWLVSKTHQFTTKDIFSRGLHGHGNNARTKSAVPQADTKKCRKF